MVSEICMILMHIDIIATTGQYQENDDNTVAIDYIYHDITICHHIAIIQCHFLLIRH